MLERGCCPSQHRIMDRSRPRRAARRAAILQIIESRSADPGLSALSVAAELGVSPRYVHALLEETGRTFTHHVLECRLQKAATLLVDPQWRERKIAEVASEVGFSDLSYFSRAFRRRFGVTASGFRDAARGAHKRA